ncbi:MAG: hypothetical protein LBH14_06040, partial [Desulfobulbaceae bacterium]|nr:hypothetical protein [Desulfobulbaceae bacterium]
MKTEEALYFLRSAQTLARYHQTLGIDHYPATANLSALAQLPHLNNRPIAPKAPVTTTEPPVRPVSLPPVASRQVVGIAAVDLANLQNCRLCADSDIQPLTAQTGRTGLTPKLFVVGDYQHGKNQDDTFIFSQEEDELLAKMLAAIALDDEDVAITNLVKCRPVINDASDYGPSNAAAERCLAHLRRQLLAARPRQDFLLPARP